MRYGVAVILALATSLVGPPGAAGVQGAAEVAGSAESARPASDLLLRVNGPLRVAAGDAVSNVVVIGDAADVQGVVREQLVVINGTARVTGRVDGVLIAIGSRVELGPTAVVGGDVVAYGGTIERAAGAVVRGAVAREPASSVGERLLRLFWISTSLAALAGAALFGALAPEVVQGAVQRVRRELPATLLATVLLACGLPLTAVAAFASGVGVPLGFGIVLLLIPLLALLGYVVVGAVIGRAVLPGRGPRAAASAAVLGVAVLQVAALVPWLGSIVVLGASQLGAGALAVYSWQRRHATAPSAAAITAMPTPAA